MALAPPRDLVNLEATIASGDALDVRRFQVDERISSLFEVSLTAVSENPDIDFESVVGQPMRFVVRGRHTRAWTGVCKDLQQTAVEERGVSTYQLSLVPALWLSSQRRNHRMFQLMSEVDIALALLGDWGVSPKLKLRDTYRKRKYRVQYGESDYTFLCRMLEDAGVSFYFDAEDGESQLVLDDAPQTNPRRAPIAFRDHPTAADAEHVTEVRIGRALRPGRYTVRDVDHRRPPTYPLIASAAASSDVEERLERFHYVPGAFVYEGGAGESTPAADDKGRYRADEGEGAALAARRLQAKRASARTVSFDTNALDPAPGAVLSFLDHPKRELGPERPLLVVASRLSGTSSGEWGHACTAVSAEAPYRPPLSTPKPKAVGVESATVVGPPGEEIHVDEFGRVRVHFHWDRESTMDDGSSCWIPVSQPWGGAGYGGTNLPRVGQEVIVDFLGADPDRPVIVGRVYTRLQQTPYRLPDNKTQSGIKTNSTTGTGGYNELMFEDAAGRELLRMQAERDLDKLVKHDETVRIGNDRVKQVGHDDTLTVGHDRSRNVGNDETVHVGRDESRVVGGDRSRSVGNDESVTIRNNRSKTIGGNEDADIAGNQSQVVGMNRTSQVGGSQGVQIGADASMSVGKSMSVEVALSKAETVGISSSESVGSAKALTVGQRYEVTAGKTMLVQVGDAYDLTCGASAIHVDAAGNVTITAGDVAIKASGPVLVEAGGTVKVQGGTVNIN
ncbi:type VI secretion system Vgr family protein [Sorangium sp. So ce426]|uniref:type VI secretion system Vgr family protein n=1 Tax=unclassified Sorangium TaxID=2621164 RepID=UPI003F5BE336